MQSSGRLSLLGATVQQAAGGWTGAAAAAQPSQQQEQQLGYGQAEHAHMMTAIRQPLFIQTPLQVMLETLVEKLQLQAGVISTMQDKLKALERNKLTGAELLSRIQLLEGRMDAATAVAGMVQDVSAAVEQGSSSSAVSSTTTNTTQQPPQAGRPGSAAASFSPFAHAKLAQQVAALQQQTTGLQAALPQLSFRVDQVLLPRLQQCEQRLAGVNNLAGSLMAVDMLAAEVGITVPHPPLSALSNGNSNGSSVSPGTTGSDGSNSSSSSSAPVAASESGAASQQQPTQPAGGVLTLSRQQLLQQQIDASKEQAGAMQQHLKQLQQQVDKLSIDAAAVQDQQLGVLAGLQDGLSGLSDRLIQQGALLRREFKPALQAAEMQQLSLAEFSKLQGQVEAADAKHAGLTKELAALKAKDFAELASSVAQLSRRVGRVTGAPGALSDTERALATAQADLRAQVEGLAARLTSHEAAELACKGLGSPSDSPGSTSSPSSSNMRGVVSRAVELALQAHRYSPAAAAAGPDGAAASRYRCLVCDRALRDGSPPRCSTAPQQQQQQQQQQHGAPELLIPLMDSFRPGTAPSAALQAAAVAGGGLTRASGISGGTGGTALQAPACNATATSSNNAPTTTTAGSGSCSMGLGPLGPGLHAAQLRQMSAHKAGRLVVSGHAGSSAVAAALAAAAAAAAGGGAGLRPARSSNAEGSAGVMQQPGPEGLSVAGRVGSSLRISSAASTAAQAAAAADDCATAGQPEVDGTQGGSGGAAGSLQRQQTAPAGPAAKQHAVSIPAASSRPQSAAAAACSPEARPGACAARPSTAAATAASASSNRPSTASPLSKSAAGVPAAASRTPVLEGWVLE